MPMTLSQQRDQIHREHARERKWLRLRYRLKNFWTALLMMWREPELQLAIPSLTSVVVGAFLYVESAQVASLYMGVGLLGIGCSIARSWLYVVAGSAVCSLWMYMLLVGVSEGMYVIIAFSVAMLATVLNGAFRWASRRWANIPDSDAR